MTPCLSFVHWLLWTGLWTTWNRSVWSSRFVRWLVIVDQWAERRNVTSCLSSAPSSTGYCQRPHRLWTTWNMLSVRWERGACAVALMLRADITHMERRLHTAQPICTCINGIYNVQRSSRYTDAISHEFHKNGKTYQNTDNMSLSGMKQLHVTTSKNHENFLEGWCGGFEGVFSETVFFSGSIGTVP